MSTDSLLKMDKFNNFHSLNHFNNIKSDKFKLNFNFSLKSDAMALINFKLIFLCAIWYFSSVISSSTTKEILRDFKYPVSLTEIQFIMNGLLCLTLLFSIKIFKNLANLNLHKNFPNGTFPPQLINSKYSIFNDFLRPNYLVLKTTVPMGMFQFVGQITSYNSTSIIPVSLVHTIKALSPLTTVLIYRFMFKKKFQIKTYLTLIPLITGVMLCCTRNNNLDISNLLFFKGSMFAFLSMLIFVSQNIFAKRILTWDDPKVESRSKEQKSNHDMKSYSDDSAESLLSSSSSSADEDDEDDDTRAKAFLTRFNWRITRPESASLTPVLPISMSSSSLNSQDQPFSKPTYFNFSSNSFNELSKHEHYADIPTKLDTTSQSKKLDKLSVLFYCSVVGFVLTLPFYLISEFQNPKISIFQLNTNTINLILMYGFSHFIQSLTAFQILGMVSPVNYSIANILKRIIIISCSIIIEGITLNMQQWTGLSLTFMGLYCYDKWGVQRSS